jgi:hypothetical protein
MLVVIMYRKSQASSTAPVRIFISTQEYIPWIAIREFPSLSRCRITSRGMRVPVMTGAPPIMFGSEIIYFLIALYYREMGSRCQERSRKIRYLQKERL